MTDESRQSVAETASHVSREWRCFFCDEVLTTRDAAAEHFGTEVGCDYPTPACQIKAHEGHLVTYIRKLEEELGVWNTESHDLQKAVVSLEMSIDYKVRRAEEDGYARGVADMRKQGFCVEPAKHEPLTTSQRPEG
ncbi:hypothetical protein JQ599_09615 [Bradyrhizobium diazoefficiens]|nr:hypothetical protein [Bradyrhizobium diazoefficiens]MBR0700156.1 hypothetical protein [Bradyrhizobium diazoefficiens]MBR0768491.1 hypothetical protein [Bradyrhizobium diazoefficiens]